MTRGDLFIVSSPSGAGKTTLIRRVLQDPRIGGTLHFSVSHTTRPPRTGERDGVEYHFVDEAGFRAIEESGGFLEWAVVFGHLYGTSRAEVEPRLEKGLDVLLDIDVHGARQVRSHVPEAVKVIIDTLLAPIMLGRDPGDPIIIHEDLYDLMRVRGFFSGYYTDALAGVDIAVWDLYAAAVWLKSRPDSTGRLGVTGFCFGGGIANSLAVRMGADLQAAAPFYGGPPATEDVPKIKAAILVHHGELDTRLTTSWPAYDKALSAANVPHEGYIYPGAGHGFNCDATPERYNKAAADLAWQRTIDWFNKYVRG